MTQEAFGNELSLDQLDAINKANPDQIRLLAEQGVPDAQYVLACNLDSAGDSESADEWRLTAAKNGSVYAQYDMGIILLEQWSSQEFPDPQLRVDAMDWFLDAARGGDPMAVEQLRIALTPESFHKLGL